MSVTISGIPIVELPDLGAVTDSTSVVAEHAGSGRVSAPSMRTYFQTGIAHTSQLTALSASSYGTVGDGITDDTAALQAAIDAATAAAMPLFIPPGRYLISAPLLIKRGVRIYGAMVEPQVQSFGVPVTLPTGAGTWILLDGTDLVSVFVLSPAGTVTQQNQAFGVEISHLGIYHTQPAPAPGWAPALYPPAIDIPGASDVYLHDLCILCPTHAIRAVGIAPEGRITIERITGQPLTVGIELDNIMDTVTIRDIHFWCHWSLQPDVLTWQKAHLFGMLLGRVDNPIVDNFFVIWAWVGCNVTATAAGGVSLARFTNCDFDICGNSFIINDVAYVGSHTIFMSGCVFANPGDTTPSSCITITGISSASQIYVTNSSITGAGNSAVSNIASGGGNHVRINNTQFIQWDTRNAGSACLASNAVSNSIRVDSTSLFYSTYGVSNIVGGPQVTRDPALCVVNGVMAAGATVAVVPHPLGLIPGLALVTPNANITPALLWTLIVDPVQVSVFVNAAPGAGVGFSVLLGII